MSRSDGDALDVADLQKVPFLAGLQESEVAALALAAAVRSVSAGDCVFRTGDPGQELFVILDGEVAIELETSDDRATTLAVLPEGTVFGEINFLLASQRTATARAVRDSRLMSLSRVELDALRGLGREAVAHLMETLARVLALRLADMDREMVEFARQVAEAHPDVADLAERLAHRRDRVLNEWAF